MDIRCKYYNRKFFEAEIIKKNNNDKTLIIINIRCNHCKQINKLSFPACFVKNKNK